MNLDELGTVLVETGLEPPQPDKAAEWIAALGRAVLTPTEIGKLNLPKRQPVLGTWFLEGDLGFIYGPRGLGKTWLAMLMARAISDGKSIGPWTAPEARKVLYVDGEMAVDASLERAEQLRQGDDGNFLLLHHEPLFHLTGKVLNLTTLEAQTALTEACLAQGIKVLILDNISCLLTLKENESDAWGERVLPWLLELRRHRIAVVFVHHAGRNGLMRGTSKREDAAFWSIKLSEAKGEHHGEGASFVATFDKNRNATNEETPSLLWHFEPKPDGSVVPTWTTLTPLQIFIGLVEDGLDSCGEIAQEMNVSKATVSRLAKKALQAGTIIMNGRNYEFKKSA
ncbi:MAG: AAA family ATPase [Methylacidiphilales bacterium]|nr:AAA family ATPase [Candidatus Methylacidiphilales bacterium]